MLRDSKLIKILRCPVTKGILKYSIKKKTFFSNKNINYKVLDQVLIIFKKNNHNDKKIKRWWSDLYKQLYLGFDESLHKKKLLLNLKLFLDFIKKQKHLLYCEMLSEKLKNKNILEIGSGSGAHSALLLQKGANVISVDISLNRSISTSRKLIILDQNHKKHLTINTNAENLPIKDSSIDYVYSNGVLHHANNTEKCIQEIYRVLKPGGKAILMFYCKSSAEYWLNILPKAIITGAIFKKKRKSEWIGYVTEGKPKFDNQRNLITRVYSRKKLIELLKDFEILKIRKHNFSFKDFCFPKLTQIRIFILNLIGRKAHPGGQIVYGRDEMIYTNLEMKLGKSFGFSRNLVIKKPS